jgi:hypothetical protein
MGALRRPFLKKIGAGAGALLMGHSGYELLETVLVVILDLGVFRPAIIIIQSLL